MNTVFVFIVITLPYDTLWQQEHLSNNVSNVYTTSADASVSYEKIIRLIKSKGLLGFNYKSGLFSS